MSRKRNLLLWIVFFVITTIFNSACHFKKGNQFKTLDFGGDFTLSNPGGQEFKLSQLKGKMILLFFGYINCPDFCPMTLDKIKQMKKQFKEEEIKQIQTVFVSVDPKRDTPYRLKNYLNFMDPSGGVIGVTGTKEELDKIIKQYYGTYTIHEPDKKNNSYSVDHTTTLFVIDQDLKLRVLINEKDTVDFMVTVLQQLLDEAKG